MPTQSNITFYPEALFRRELMFFAKGIENHLSSGGFAIKSKILDNILAVSGALNKMNLDRSKR
jgi:hypothetical protein